MTRERVSAEPGSGKCEMSSDGVSRRSADVGCELENGRERWLEVSEWENSVDIIFKQHTEVIAALLERGFCWI